MADIRGIKITDLTACGASDDGEHVWITHRLGDGSEYPLVYSFEAVGYLMTALADAARTAQRRRLALHPQEASDGSSADAMPVEVVRVGTSDDDSAVLLHFTTADRVAIAVELPARVVQDFAGELQRVARAVAPAARPRRLH